MALVKKVEEKKGFNHIVGVVKAEKVLINPNLSQLKEYGATWMNQEPNYKGDGQFILDVYYKISQFTYKDKSVVADKEIRNVRFYIKPEAKIASTGKTLFVNAYGQFTYLDNAEACYDWFDKTGLRPALDGEEALYKWLKAYGNFVYNEKKGIKEEMTLSPELLKVGDFSELEAFVKEGDRKFYALLGLSYNTEKGHYRSVTYTKRFFPSWQTGIGVKDENGTWQNLPWAIGIPNLLAQDRMDFNKSVVHPGEAMILTKGEVDAMANMPDISAETNAAVGEQQEDSLPF